MDSSFSTRFAHTCASTLHLDARACAYGRCHGHGTLRGGIVPFDLHTISRVRLAINGLEDTKGMEVRFTGVSRCKTQFAELLHSLGNHLLSVSQFIEKLQPGHSDRMLDTYFWLQV